MTENRIFYIFDLPDKSEDELMELICETLDEFPILREIYDEDFLIGLIRKRFNLDNYLLLLLSSKMSFAHSTWKSIAENLQILKDCNAVLKFKNKLRILDKLSIEAVKTELEFPAHYKRKGYSVKIEPKISSTGNNPDFSVLFEREPIFFEIKSLSEGKALSRYENLEKKIRSRLRRLDQLFVISISYGNKLMYNDIKALEKFTKKKLHELSEIEKKEVLNLPLQFNFENKAELIVHGKPNRLPYGYLGVLSGPSMFIDDIKRTRRVIKSAVSGGQLPPNNMGVVVVDCTLAQFINKIDIEDAIFGYLNMMVDNITLKTKTIRTGKKVFEKKGNRRISAVIFYIRKFHDPDFIFISKVYNNPYAIKPIPISFFREPIVEQYVRKEISKNKYIIERIE